MSTLTMLAVSNSPSPYDAVAPVSRLSTSTAKLALVEIAARPLRSGAEKVDVDVVADAVDVAGLCAAVCEVWVSAAMADDATAPLITRPTTQRVHDFTMQATLGSQVEGVLRVRCALVVSFRRVCEPSQD